MKRDWKLAKLWLLGKRPEVLFTGRYSVAAGRNYDIHPDGQRFMMLKDLEEQASAPSQLTVVLNWFEELKRLVPTGE